MTTTRSPEDVLKEWDAAQSAREDGPSDQFLAAVLAVAIAQRDQASAARDEARQDEARMVAERDEARGQREFWRDQCQKAEAALATVEGHLKVTAAERDAALMPWSEREETWRLDRDNFRSRALKAEAEIAALRAASACEHRRYTDSPAGRRRQCKDCFKTATLEAYGWDWK